VIAPPIDRLEAKARKVRQDIDTQEAGYKDEYTEAMRFYYDYLTQNGEQDTPEQYQYTFAMREDPVMREIIEALLLSNADPEDVEKIFEVQPEMLATYKELFFETDNFISKLDVISYLENYPQDAGRALKVRAHSLGPEFIYFRYADIVPSSTKQKDLVKKIFLTSAYKAMEANYNNVASANTKAATQHATIMLKAYEAIQKLMEDPNAEGNKQIMTILIGKNAEAARRAAPGEII
jgi:hypothetical protein